MPQLRLLWKVSKAKVLVKGEGRGTRYSCCLTWITRQSTKDASKHTDIVCTEFFQFTSFPIQEKEQHNHLPWSICLLLACQRGRGAPEALPLNSPQSSTGEWLGGMARRDGSSAPFSGVQGWEGSKNALKVRDVPALGSRNLDAGVWRKCWSCSTQIKRYFEMHKAFSIAS